MIMGRTFLTMHGGKRVTPAQGLNEDLEGSF